VPVLDVVPESMDANAFDVLVAAGGELVAPPNIEPDGLELKENPEDAAGYRQSSTQERGLIHATHSFCQFSTRGSKRPKRIRHDRCRSLIIVSLPRLEILLEHQQLQRQLVSEDL